MKVPFQHTLESLDKTSEGMEEMFEVDAADMCAGKIPLVSMGG